MDIQALRIIQKIHGMLIPKGSQAPTISDAEIAYITGLLEGIIQIYTQEHSPERPSSKLDNLGKKFGL